MKLNTRRLGQSIVTSALAMHLTPSLYLSIILCLPLCDDWLRPTTVLSDVWLAIRTDWLSGFCIGAQPQDYAIYASRPPTHKNLNIAQVRSRRVLVIYMYMYVFIVALRARLPGSARWTRATSHSGTPLGYNIECLLRIAARVLRDNTK